MPRNLSNRAAFPKHCGKRKLRTDSHQKLLNVQFESILSKHNLQKFKSIGKVLLSDEKVIDILHEHTKLKNRPNSHQRQFPVNFSYGVTILFWPPELSKLENTGNYSFDWKTSQHSLFGIWALSRQCSFWVRKKWKICHTNTPNASVNFFLSHNILLVSRVIQTDKNKQFE